jgi:hypothetical protein
MLTGRIMLTGQIMLTGPVSIITMVRLQMQQPDPHTWSKTMEDLLAEMSAGKRSIITDEEGRLAVAFERSQLPDDVRFPKEGETYEAIRDVEVSFLTHYRAPFTGGARTLLPRGERVRVTCVNGKRPIGVYCTPLRYDELHPLIVSEAERERPEYNGYSLSIKTIQLNREFRLV